jgi:hypothetical protein
MVPNFLSDRDAFNAFLEKRLSKISSGLSLEDVLVEFRAYQQELAAVQAKIQEAKDSSRRGESQELNVEELFHEITEEMAAEGIHEQP